METRSREARTRSYTGILAVIPHKLRRAVNRNHVQVLMTDDLISDDQSQPCASSQSVPASASITLADVIDVAGAPVLMEPDDTWREPCRECVCVCVLEQYRRAPQSRSRPCALLSALPRRLHLRLPPLCLATAVSVGFRR
jgi:hypothetical protein